MQEGRPLKKQTQNTHPHAYTLWRNAHCRPEMGEVWLTDTADTRMHRYPLLPIQRGCQNTQRFLWGGTPTLQHGASQLTTHTQIHLLSLSVSPNLLLNGSLCILELMFSSSVYLSLLFSLSFSRSAISMSPCSLGLVILSFPLCSIRWLLWITAVALLCPLSLNLLGFWTILSNKLDLWLCVILLFKAGFCPVLSSSSITKSFL